MLEQLQMPELTPEERVKKSQALQAQLEDKINVLDVLSDEAKELLQEDGENVEAEQLKAEVLALKDSLVGLHRAVESQISSVGRDLTNWQEYKTGIQQIKPWIEQAEVEVNMGIPKPVSLQEAQQLLDSAKAFDKQCEEHLGKLQGVAALSQQITCRTNAADEVDAIHSRWAAVHDVAVQWGTMLEKMVASWQEFDEVQKVETWIDQEQRAILETPVNLSTPHVAKLEDELTKLKVFVERYEAIVSDHQQYSKAVMDTQEWLDATHNTVLLWGDLDLERISLHTNLERLKNLQLSLPEEEPRIQLIRSLGETVIPGTLESGQVNIRAQIDSSQQDWEGLISSVKYKNQGVNVPILKLNFVGDYNHVLSLAEVERKKSAQDSISS